MVFEVKDLVDSFERYGEIFRKVFGEELKYFSVILFFVEKFYSDYLFGVKVFCWLMWVKFDLNFIFVGIFVIFVVVVLVVLVFFNFSEN